MSMTTTDLRIRVDAKLKKEVDKVLKREGISVADMVRAMMKRVVEERHFPYADRKPNAESLESMADLDAGRIYSCTTLAELKAALHAED